jgi:polysaccharide pyruvyl transferase WcaK-like protein
MTDTYVDAFDFPEKSLVYSSRLRWGVAFAWALAKGRASFVFPPGPYPLTSRRAAFRSRVSALIAGAVRARGGASITAGKSVRGNDARAVRAERALVTRSSLYVVRDLLSSEALGVPLRHAPDIALLEEPSTSDSGQRRVVSLSVRYDRILDTRVLGDIVAWAATVGLDVTLVSQVRRDDKQHGELARSHGLDAVLWESATHRDHTERVKAAYRASALVITDRLHAAIFGINEGAVPVAIAEPNRPSKIRDAFVGVLPYFAVDPTDSVDSAVLDGALRSRAEFVSSRERAYRELVVLRQDVRAALES